VAAVLAVIAPSVFATPFGEPARARVPRQMRFDVIKHVMPTSAAIKLAVAVGSPSMAGPTWPRRGACERKRPNHPAVHDFIAVYSPRGTPGDDQTKFGQSSSGFGSAATFAVRHWRHGHQELGWTLMTSIPCVGSARLDDWNEPYDWTTMITVLIATFNGGDILEITLESLTRLEAPDARWELVVVDNASTDHTDEILRKYETYLPMKVISCPTPGKNIALNHGLKFAKGDLIVNTDDDVVVEPNWLRELESAARRYSDYSVFAGQVRHFWQKRPPSWLERLANEGQSFAGTDRARTTGPIPAGLAKGPNLAFRRNVLKQFQYPTGIGPDGTSDYIKGSETSVLLEMNKAGYEVMYISEAIVKHIVRPNQIGVFPVLRRYYFIGRGVARLTGQSTGTDAPRILGFKRYVYREAATHGLNAIFTIVRGNTYASMRKLIELQMLLGQAVEDRRNHRRHIHRSSAQHQDKKVE